MTQPRIRSSQRYRHRFIPRPRVVHIAAMLAALLVGLAAGTISAAGLSERHDQLGTQVDRAQALALSILKQIKRLDNDCRGANGVPRPALKSEARTRLARIENLKGSFEDVASQARGEITTIEKELTRQSDDPAAATVRDELPRLSGRLDKLAANVNKYYDRSVSDFGPPSSNRGPAVPVMQHGKLAISGEATAGLGFSGYKRPNANPDFKASGADLSFGVKGRMIPAENTDVQAHLSHQSTVQRREIGITRFGGSVKQTLPNDMSVGGGFNLMKYSDKDFDAANYGDLGLFANFAIERTNLRFNTQLQRVGRSYSNLNNADYATTTLLANATVPFGLGHLKLRLRYLTRSYDVADPLDHKEMNPSAIYVFSKSGSEVGLSYQAISHPNVDNDVRDNTRLKAHLHMVRKGAGTVSKFGPEVALYQFGNDDNRNYTDIKLISRKSSRGRAMTTTTWEAAYRMIKDSLQFDFAQITRRVHRRPIGSGGYFKFDFASRFYTESAPDDSLFQFAYLAPPHTADIYVSFGWSKAATGMFERISFGPSVGAKFYFDTERNDLFKDSPVDVDYLWRNPQNNARAGFEVTMSGSTPTGVLWRGEARYQMAFLYNADPTRSTNLFEIKTTVTYPVNEKWMVDGYANYHRTRASVESASDLDKNGIGVKARYLFDYRH